MTQSWGFITNRALVMVYVVCHGDSTVREIAAGLGITERAILAILRDLDEEGIISRHRDGRRNAYSVNFDVLRAYRQDAATRTPTQLVDALIGTLASLGGQPLNGASAAPPVAAMPTADLAFFTNHLLTVLEITYGDAGTAREMALRAGLTERAMVNILRQLNDEGIIIKSREGRCNTYEVDFDAFKNFPRWSPGPWQLPPVLIDLAVTGLRALAQNPALLPRREAPPAEARATAPV